MGDGWMMIREGGTREHANRFCGSPSPSLICAHFYPPPSLPPFKFRFEDGNLNSPLLGMQTTWRGSCWTWHRLLPLPPILLLLCCAARSICFLTPSSSAPFTISLSFLASCSRSFLGALVRPLLTLPNPPFLLPRSFWRQLARRMAPLAQMGWAGAGGSFV